MALCEASAIYLCPIAPKLGGHLLMYISLLCANFHTHLLSNYFPVIFQRFCPERNFVKEVYSRHVQMRWNLVTSFIWSNHASSPNLSSWRSYLWAQLQVLVSGKICTLWSNPILPCFIWAANLPGHSYVYLYSLHQVLAQSSYSFTLSKFYKILSRMELCEASATLVTPNGMRFLQQLHMVK